MPSHRPRKRFSTTPPKTLNEAIQAIYLELAAKAPKGRLKAGDETLVEIAATLLCRFRWNRSNPGELKELRALLAVIGMSPEGRDYKSVQRPPRKKRASRPVNDGQTLLEP
jgi:hypothetical protein